MPKTEKKEVAGTIFVFPGAFRRTLRPYGGRRLLKDRTRRGIKNGILDLLQHKIAEKRKNERKSRGKNSEKKGEKRRARKKGGGRK